MDAQAVTALGREAMFVAIMVSLPPLGLALVVGLVVSIFQALTQIQDQTLTFVPKIAAVVVALLLFGTWTLQKMSGFMASVIGGLNHFCR